MNPAVAYLLWLSGGLLLFAAVLWADRLVDCCWAVADRWHDRWAGRRANDRFLTVPLPDRSMRYVEREARRG